MSYINPVPPGNGLSAHLGNVTDAVNSHHQSVNSGLIISKRHDAGTHIELAQQPNRNFNSYTTLLTNYDPTKEYWPGQQVLVDSRLTYNDSYTFPDSSPTLTFGSGSSGSVSLGTFICISYVPPAWNTASIFLNTIVPAYGLSGGTANNADADHYRWNGFNNYYPQNPNIPLTNQGPLSMSGFVIQSGVTYWLPLGSPPNNSGSSIQAYDVTGNTSYSAGQRVYVATQFTLNGVTCLPGTFELISGYSTPNSPFNGQIPFIPFVPGYSNWWPTAAGMVGVSTCASGVSTTVYINSTGLL
jgi:hypothetical protein